MAIPYSTDQILPHTRTSSPTSSQGSSDIDSEPKASVQSAAQPVFALLPESEKFLGALQRRTIEVVTEPSENDIQVSKAAMEALEIRTSCLESLRAFLIGALVVLAIALMICAIVIPNPIALGIIGGLFLIAGLVYLYTKHELANADSQIDAIGESIGTMRSTLKNISAGLTENPDIPSERRQALRPLIQNAQATLDEMSDDHRHVKLRSLHRRMEIDRSDERIRKWTNEFLKDKKIADWKAMTIDQRRDLILHLQREGAFKIQDNDPFEIVSKLTGFRPLIIHEILDGVDLFRAKVKEKAMPLIVAHKIRCARKYRVQVAPSIEPTLTLIYQYCRSRLGGSFDDAVAFSKLPSSIKEEDRAFYVINRALNRYLQGETRRDLVLYLISKGMLDRPDDDWAPIIQKLGIAQEFVRKVQAETSESIDHFPLIDALDQADLFEGARCAVTYSLLREHFGITPAMAYEYRQSLQRYRESPL